jgi:hypothetical protein
MANHRPTGDLIHADHLAGIYLKLQTLCKQSLDGSGNN